MDYFDSNMKDKMSEFDNQLPPGMDWENMREGVYEKMGKQRSSNPWKWFSICLLLLMGGCGSWMTLNYFNAGEEQELVDQPLANNKPENEVTEIAKLDHAQKEITAQKDQVESPVSNSNEIVDQVLPKNKVQSTKLSNPRPSPPSRTITHIDKLQQSKNTLPTKTPKPTIIATEKNGESNSQNNSATILTPASSEPFVLLESRQAKLLDVIEQSSEDLMVLTTSDFNSKKKIKPAAKKSLSGGIAIGANNWTARSSNSSNGNFVKGFPGYMTNAFLQFNLNEKNGVVLGYQYSFLQELFDYEETKNVAIEKPNALVRQYVSSLTGNVVGQTHSDTSALATRYLRELKYNSYQLQSLQLSYARLLKIGKKSNVQLTVGGTYLFKITGKGKRLNHSGDLISFDQDNSSLSNNQFALRMSVGYDYTIAKRTSLFVQVAGTKYLTNWESGASEASRPLIYAGSLGIRKHF